MTERVRNARLTTALRILLYLGLVGGLIAAGSSFLEYELLAREDFTDEEWLASDTREIVIGLVQSALSLVTIVVFSCWIYHANKAVIALGATVPRISPGWAVGSFFVPFINLWVPYMEMKKLWRASHDPLAAAQVRVSPLLSVWWGVWIVTHLLGTLIFQLWSRAESIESFRTANQAQLGAEAVDVLLHVVTIAVVSRIHGAQVAASEGSLASTFE